MKGIILAGGTGSRLSPLTNVTNKHLLPIYNKPMIYYPLFSLKRAGIDNILIVSGRGHAGSFLELLGSGSHLGLNIAYEVQEEAGGIAQALSLAEDFANNEKVVVILGDNVIEDDISEAVENFKVQSRGAQIFLKEVANPEAYGVAEIEDGKIKSIIEKPVTPPSNFAVIGAYMYDSLVFDIIRNLTPSQRNEFEITDVNNHYLRQGTLKYNILDGFWGDCGESFDSMLGASQKVQKSYLANIDKYLNLSNREHSSLDSQTTINFSLKEVANE